GAAFGKHDLAMFDLVGIKRIEESRTTRGVGQMIRTGGDEKEYRHVRGSIFGPLPIDRLLFGIADLDRRDLPAADEGAEMQQPLLAEQTDIQVDAIERTQGAYRVGSILQHAHGARHATHG